MADSFGWESESPGPWSIGHSASIMLAMTKQTKFLMIGGFLGAGKTTTISRLAQYYMDLGLQVGLVMNDQANDLVDTFSLRAQGFDVAEVPGACFCCRFDGLVDVLKELGQEGAPDVILAEPVGSCTDVVATVIEPLRDRHGQKYAVGPLAVLVKPEHGRKILRRESKAGFSPKASYIFLKQIEEADIVVLNKVDKLSVDERNDLLQLLNTSFPEKQVLAISAREGQGLTALVSALGQPAPAHDRPMEVDYDTYAEGEAELGWLNSQATVSRPSSPFPLDEILFELVTELKGLMHQAGVEPAHLKVLGQAGGSTGVCNLVAGGEDVELSIPSQSTASEANLIVNARVATSPDALSQMVQQAIDAVAGNRQLVVSMPELQSFQPGRPVPTHRYGARSACCPPALLKTAIDGVRGSRLFFAARLGIRMPVCASLCSPQGRRRRAKGNRYQWEQALAFGWLPCAHGRVGSYALLVGAECATLPWLETRMPICC